MAPPIAPIVTREESPPSVNGDRVDAIATLLHDRFQGETSTVAKWDDPLFWNIEASPAERCQFLAIGNAINFRFWDLTDGKVIPSVGRIDGQPFRGSMYLWRRLRRAISCEELPLDADALARLTTHDLARAFADDDGHVPLAPGIMDRLANLQDLGVRLSANWEGLFLRVVDAAAGSLERFAGLSADFRAFDDPVRKLTMVNAIMLTGSGLASFDRDPLPGVDYHLVKQVLRQGLVSPPSVLRHKLVVGELLEAQESLELRTAVLEALVQVADRAGMSTAFIDNLYWLNRRVCGEDHPSCSTCPFEAGCIQHTEIGLPLEMTRYY